MRVIIKKSSQFSKSEIEDITKKYQIEISSDLKGHNIYLEFYEDRLQLCCMNFKHFNPIYVDFTSDTAEYRRKVAGGRKQAIARAVGLRGGSNPCVLDVTAGLGQDAFVLASLGCRVHMLERNSVIAALLEDGLRRAKLNKEIGGWVRNRITMDFGDSQDIIDKLPFSPDVVYLDPMFPKRKKSALVKKEMQLFHEIVGDDTDSGNLLKKSLTIAENRVVVKRPITTDPLNNFLPDSVIKTKLNRFDVYLMLNRMK